MRGTEEDSRSPLQGGSTLERAAILTPAVLALATEAVAPLAASRVKSPTAADGSIVEASLASGLSRVCTSCGPPPSPPCFAAQLPLTPEASELFGQNCCTAGQKTPVFQSKLPKINDNSRQFGSF